MRSSYTRQIRAKVTKRDNSQSEGRPALVRPTQLSVTAEPNPAIVQNISKYIFCTNYISKYILYKIYFIDRLLCDQLSSPLPLNPTLLCFAVYYNQYSQYSYSINSVQNIFQDIFQYTFCSKYVSIYILYKIYFITNPDDEDACHAQWPHCTLWPILGFTFSKKRFECNHLCLIDIYQHQICSEF